MMYHHNRWSPLARGLLTGKNRQSTRSSTDRAIKRFFDQATEANNDAIVDRVVQIAENKGLAPAHVRSFFLYPPVI